MSLGLGGQAFRTLMEPYPAPLGVILELLVQAMQKP